MPKGIPKNGRKPRAKRAETPKKATVKGKATMSHQIVRPVSTTWRPSYMIPNDNVRFCSLFKNNLTLIHRVCFAIFLQFIQKNIMMVPEEIKKFFHTLQFKPVLFCSTLRCIPIDSNLLVLYPFGYEEQRGIRIVFSRANTMKGDCKLLEFIEFLRRAVMNNAFRKHETFNNCCKFYDFFIYNATLFDDLKNNILCYFAIFLDQMLRCDSNFFLDAFNIKHFLKELEQQNVQYNNVPISMIPLKLEKEK